MKIYAELVMVVGLVTISTSKNLTAKSTVLPYYNILNFTWTSPDGKTIKLTIYFQVYLKSDCSVQHILIPLSVGGES
jgi:hypothetical protein